MRLTVSSKCVLLRKWAVNFAVMLNTKRVSGFPVALQYVVVWPSSASTASNQTNSCNISLLLGTGSYLGQVGATYTGL